MEGMSTMRKTVTSATLALLAAAPVSSEEKELKRLTACREVIEELATLPEGMPQGLLDKADCVVVIPGVKKAALGVGGRLGWGAASCRSDRGKGEWSAPLMVSLKGGSLGLQIGGESTDLVLLVMNPKGIDHLLRSKFTLGADASVAAGPLGRNASASTDALMNAEILSYSRARGVFAGISLEGASLAPDNHGNLEVYEKRVSAQDLLLSPASNVPSAGAAFVGTLQRLSPKHRD
jgi:lipid-binding SYLF domain-containing protein